MARYSPIELAQAFIHTGELSDALDALNPYLEVNPNDAAALRMRAAVLMRLPGEDHARAALADISKLDPKTADDYIQESVIMQMGLGNWTAAVTATEQAHELTPEDDRITERLLMLYDQVGEVVKAQALLMTLPQTWRWLQLAGDLAQKSHETNTAIELYSQSLALLQQKMDTENNPIARNVMGMIVGSRAAAQLEVGHLAAAQADYELVSDIFPTDLSYALMVAITFALQEKLDDAVWLCQTTLRDEPALAATLQEKAVTYSALKPLLEQLGL